jgi:hypothetical protein
MAYLRNEKETVEMDFPLSKVWEAIAQTVTRLEWTIETTDETTHRLQAKTKSAFLSYSSVITIETKSVSENITRVSVTAETPVTIITSALDFGKTQERVDLFLRALAIQLNPESNKPKEKN